MGETNLAAAVQKLVQEEFKLTFSPLVFFAFAACINVFLFCPFKLLQFICLAIIGTILLSFFYALVLKSNIQIERNTNALKLACKEKSEITFTIKNFSSLTAHVCYFFDSVPYFYIFDEGNKGITSLRPHEIKRITYRVTSQERGLFHAGPVRIRTSDPLGLFLIRNRYRPDLRSLSICPLPGQAVSPSACAGQYHHHKPQYAWHPPCTLTQTDSDTICSILRFGP